jgi:hypothetical protein
VGQVYVANTSSVKLLYQVNGAAISPGWPGTQGGPPVMITAPLVRYPEGGKFNLGNNTFTAQFTDQEGGPYQFSFRFDPAQMSVDANYLIYVFRGYASLLNQFGYVLQTSGTPVPPPPSPPLNAQSAGPT